MIRFEKLAATEKNYPFVNAKTAAAYKNGTFGTITDGVFTAGAGFFVIMNMEDGDDAKSADYVIPEGADVRVCDLSTVIGQIVDITSDGLPTTLAEEDKLDAGDNGALKVNASAGASYLKVIELTNFGCRATIVK